MLHSGWIVRHSLGLICLCFLATKAICQEPAKPAEPDSVLSKFRERVPAVKEFASNPWTKNWIDTVADLPVVQPRTVRVKERDVQVDENRFYNRYGSPLAYARLLDIAMNHGYQPKHKSKVFDFGYGSIGHLQMLARSGLDVTAVDVDALLPAIYDRTSGQVGTGSIKLLSGRFPADDALVSEAGAGYGLFISKNTLKLGYIHPTRELPDPRHRIDLGVTDETFLSKVADMLNPGGLLVIHNLCPAKSPADKPYVSWAEGECPFPRALFENHGFEVLEFDVDESATARKLGKALGWDQPGGMDLEKDLFAWYTVARKKS
ncbi:MAG: hypothetical protein U0930_21875 [Pirellulales bacterium]